MRVFAKKPLDFRHSVDVMILGKLFKKHPLSLKQKSTESDLTLGNSNDGGHTVRAWVKNSREHTTGSRSRESKAWTSWSLKLKERKEKEGGRNQIMFQGEDSRERRKERQIRNWKTSPRGNKVVLEKHRVPGHRKHLPSCYHQPQMEMELFRNSYVRELMNMNSWLWICHIHTGHK